MKQPGFKLLKKLPAAALAAVIALGAGASSLSFAPSVSAEAYAASVPNFNDPAKMELVYLLDASISSQQRFAQSSDSPPYWALAAAQNKALKALSDPSSAASDLFSARQQLQNALWDYDYRYVRDLNETRIVMGRLGNWIYSSYPSSDPSYLTPWEKGVVDLIDETYAYMAGLGSSRSEAVKAYQYFNFKLSALSDLETPEINRYASSLASAQARIAAPLAQLGQYGVNMDARVNDFDRASAFMQALLNNGPYNDAVYTAAMHDVTLYASTIVNSEELARAIKRAQNMVDTSPRGIRSGEYPASAFGALNRAINHAQRVLETAASAEEIKNESYELNFVATEKFEESVKP